MNLTIGKMKKRINSTKFMYEATTTLEGVVLKEPTSRSKPVFLLHKVSADGDLAGCNYCNTMGRFYWIDDIVHVTNDLIEVHCHTDVLATGAKLLRKKAYLSYCSDAATAKSDWKLYDERFGPDVPAVNKEYELQNINGTIAQKLLKPAFGDGTFVVKCLVANGGVLSWALDLHQFLQFYKDFITSAPNSLDDFTCKYFGEDWKSCFASVCFLPVKVDKYNELWENEDDITCGRIQLTGRAHYSASPVAWACGNTIINMSQPATAANNVKFLRGEQYTSVVFEYPGGNLDLSTDEFINSDNIMIEETFELTTGEYTAKIYTADLAGSGGVYSWDKGETLGIARAQLGFDITGMMQSGPNTNDFWMDVGVKAFKQLPTIAAGAFSMGNSLAGYTLGDIAGVGGLAEGGKQVTSGIIGTFAGGQQNVNARAYHIGGGLTAYYRQDYYGQWANDAFRLCISTSVPEIMATDSSDYEDYCEEYGYVCNKYVDLATLPEGTFVQAVGMSVGNTTPDTYLYAEEISEINNWVNTGVYLEDWAQA